MSIIQTTKTLRPRDDFDHYPTPIGLVEAALLKRIAPLFDGRGPVTVLDPGPGRAYGARWPALCGLMLTLSERRLGPIAPTPDGMIYGWPAITWRWSFPGLSPTGHFS